jgi:tetratricopeptide (TPR) repeat protein
MKRIFVLVLALAVGMTAPYAQEAGETQPPPPTQQNQDAVEPPLPKPPRVVGRPQTQEELDAWLAIERATSLAEKGQLAESFLTQFPDSGLTPYAHQLLALRYQEENNYEKFVYHSEKTVEELPGNFLILSALAAAYAQKDESDKAIAKAEQALAAVAAAERPPMLSEAEWRVQREQMEADAHYAIGSAHLSRHQKEPNANRQEDANLKRAVEELQEATALDPAHDRAYYHLGFAFARQDNAEKALESYARAVAIAGVTRQLAQEQLQKVYQFVYQNTDGLEQVVQEQKEYVQSQVAAKQAKVESTIPPSSQPEQSEPSLTQPE